MFHPTPDSGPAPRKGFAGYKTGTGYFPGGFYRLRNLNGTSDHHGDGENGTGILAEEEREDKLMPAQEQGVVGQDRELMSPSSSCSRWTECVVTCS